MTERLAHLGYYALTIAIIKNCMPELAFARLDDPGRKNTPVGCREIDYSIWLQMRKKGASYTEIADLYCSTPGRVYSGIRKKEATI